MKTRKISNQTSISETQSKERDLINELKIANKEIAEHIIQKRKREDELGIANKELIYQQSEKADRASELVIANEELVFQKQEKKNRANELKIANKELAYQKEEKQKRANELIIANEELSFQTAEKADRANELKLANKELRYQQTEKADRATELEIANKELSYQNQEKQDRANELLSANEELSFQTSEKANRASELITANRELAYQKQEKQDRAEELIIANEELSFQTSEKANRASELLIANKELAYQTSEKADRAAELRIANKELAFQSSEKAERASELVIANEELVFQKQEKKNRADELKIANEELAYQKQEKQNRADELVSINKELSYQISEKADRASELDNANKELAYQIKEKQERATELIIVKKTIIEQEVKIENLSYRNELPGLFNRKYFLDAIKKYDNEDNLPISIIMGDINGLAIIDDSLGHSVVEDVQSKLNNILKKVARKADVVIGFSNGEFSLILPKTTYIESVKLIEKLRALSDEEKSGPLKISVSCGSSTKTKIEEQLIEVVDIAVEQLEKDRNIVSPTFESHTIDLIMKMLFEKNNREMLHSTRVSKMCEKIASRLNFDLGVVERIRITGMLHDIGKIGIDERILNKTERLNKADRDTIKKHPEIGYRILSASNDFMIHAEDVLQHHERIDGEGYPNGIKGDEISIVAKIIAIADTYDAITSDRPYRKALSKQEAILEIEKCSGIQFDSEIVKVFVDMLYEKDNINL